MTNETKILGENTRPTKYNPNLAQQMAKQIEEEEQRAALEAKTRKPVEENTPLTGYIYLPSQEIYVAKWRILNGKNWYESHKILQERELRMLTIPQFIEFLKYLRSNPNEIGAADFLEIELILDDILALREPYRGEWLDASFKKLGNNRRINYNHEFKIITGEIPITNPKNSEPLEDCLMENRNVVLDAWLNNPTSQGLPKTNAWSGNLSYQPPAEENTSVAEFYVNSRAINLICTQGPTFKSENRGVRPVLIPNNFH